MQNKIPFFVTGIVLSILFWVFRVAIYELPYYSPDFTNSLWNNGVYEAVAAITLAMGWAGAAIYYYVINSAVFDRWWHWLAIMAVTVVLTPVICYLVMSAMLAGKDFEGPMVQFEMYNLIVVAATYVVASFSIKWWSSNCRHSPC